MSHKADRGKILAVDDSPTMLQWIIGVLEGEFQVSSADSVAKGLDLLKRAPVDVVLTDYDLGDGTGIDLLRAATGGDSHAAGILMTAHRDAEDVREVQKSGRVLVLFKPVEAAQLVAWVRNAFTMARLAATTKKL